MLGISSQRFPEKATMSAASTSCCSRYGLSIDNIKTHNIPKHAKLTFQATFVHKSVAKMPEFAVVSDKQRSAAICRLFSANGYRRAKPSCAVIYPLA